MPKAPQPLARQTLQTSVMFMVFLGAMSALAPLSVDAYLPVLGQLGEHFQVDLAAVNLTISAYLIGNALGQFFGGALSDQLGRKPVGSFALLIFSAATLAIILAPGIYEMQGLRVVQALGGGALLVVCMAQVRDLYPVEEVPRRLASVILVMMVAPMVAPLLGLWLSAWGWQMIFVFLALYGLLCWYIFTFKIPELMLTAPTGINFVSLFVNYWGVLKQRQNGRLTALLYNVFSALTGAVYFVYLTNAALIFDRIFGLSALAFCWVFAAGGLSMLLGNFFAARRMKTTPPMALMGEGNLLQLLATMLLFLTAISEVAEVYSVIVLICLCLFAGGAVRPTAAGVYMTFFDHNSGAAASIQATLLFVLGALVGALSAVLSQGTLMPIFAIMLVCSVAARGVFVAIRRAAVDAS
ncbi:MAG: Bcr/CflA family efflux MFS transporter [Porticoccaceae bacterium]|nr:Bcr/CflA family efflux MFS transporter [Porticoccaceae bacterium]